MAGQAAIETQGLRKSKRTAVRILTTLLRPDAGSASVTGLTIGRR